MSTWRRVTNWEQYYVLRRKGYSKLQATRISHASMAKSRKKTR